MPTSSPTYPLLIIGAGPAGLAMAGRLRNAGLDFHIVEKSENVGSRWHHHYDRLCLHTVKKRSHLPHLPFPDDYPRYVPRKLLIEYFESYARHFNIKPEFNTDIKSIQKNDNALWIAKSAGKTYRAEKIVIATGTNNKPAIPSWPGSDQFGGNIIHSIDYRNPQPFTGKRVLVVGMGNTGAEIALDLAGQGIPVWLSVRGTVNIVPRDLNGRPVQETGRILARFPLGIGDWLGSKVQSLYFGNLKKYGLERSKLPPAAQLRKTGKTPVVDVGTIKAIKEGLIKMAGEIEQFLPSGIRFKDGRFLEFDEVILATGYRTGLETLVENISDFLDSHGFPEHSVGKGFHKGLYFLGFNNYELGGILGTIYRDSDVIVKDIIEAD